MGATTTLSWLLPCLLAVLAQKENDQKSTDCYSSVTGTIYDYGALTLEESQFIPFKQYQGKTVLFVNVATF